MPLSPKKTRKNVVICICGLTASGKSTVARRLAEKYNLRFYSGGEALKTLARDAGYTPTDRGWWESREGLRFLSKRMSAPDFDEEVDKKLLQVAKEGNVVLDSWTMPWLFDDGFKVWIDASKQIRIMRLAKRDGISIEKASQVLEEKEEKTKTIYKRLYGFSLGEDFSPFDLILGTDKLNADEVFEAVSLVIDHVLLKKPSANQ